MQADLAVTASTDRFDELYERHAPAAARLAYLLTGNRDLASDLAQEAFVIMLQRFRDIREPAAFPAYLRTTVVNLTRRHARRQRLERSLVNRQARNRAAQNAQPDVETADELWKAVHRLPHRQRAAIVLRYYEDLSERDAAETLGVSLPALKGLVTRAFETLRTLIPRED